MLRCYDSILSEPQMKRISRLTRIHQRSVRDKIWDEATDIQPPIRFGSSTYGTGTFRENPLIRVT
ncbi:MAG: hypothetical protein GVY20_16800 [Bacteroidetes bacterium]|nr:hypothetical protein [Bacteroidota bacterium]